MTKVSLRVYNHEIEGLIEASQLDEAIAHCQHILKTFPMCVETYRLLGKTFLEARRYGDAADIFQRALMATPDDFVSHVGMSIIRDDEGKLDEAIWHMERAFEIQPSNSAIQSELRRLYGRRDGVEPPKIRLSRDALANMYSQGGLFNQAIAEIRSVLAEDPNRPDLQVMLARAYYRVGQKVEAAEMAATLLKKYPYCLDALRVLVDVLPGTAQGENTQIYKHRLGMLDPYSLFTTDSVFNSDQVGDSAVSLERFEYKPGAAPASSEPEWANSLGIQLESERKAEGTPTWLQPDQPAAPASAENLAAGPGEQNDSVPAWMRAAGWQESAGSNDEPPSELEAEPTAEPASQADIPDWVKSMAPAGIGEPENAPANVDAGATSNDASEIPDWLQAMKPTGLESGGVEAIPPVASSTPPAVSAGLPPAEEEEEIPDWLKSLTPAASAAGGNGGSQPAPEETPAKADIPDWLKAAAPEATSQSEPSLSQPAPIEPLPAEPAPAAIEAEIPDWLRPASPATLPEEIKMEEPAAPEAVTPAPAEEFEMPDWLNSTASTAEVKDEAVSPAELETPAAAPLPVENELTPAEAAEIPDWLKSMAPAAAPEPEKFESEAVSSEPPAPVPVPEPSSQIEVPDWLRPLASNAPAAISEIPAPAQPNAEAEFPDWLKSLNQPSNEGTESAEPTAASVEPPAMEIPSEKAAEAAFPDWLNALEPEVEKPSDLEDTRPTPAISLSKRTEPEPAEAVSLPDWLSGLEKTGEPPAELAESPVNENPVPVEPVIPQPEIPVEPAAAVPSQPAEPGEFVPSGEIKSLSIDDNALGWLESLAAKQGANPDELLTKPEDRQASIPESWLPASENTEEAGKAEAAAEPAKMETTPEEPPRAPLETLPLPSLDTYIQRDAHKQPLETLPLRPIDILGFEQPSAPELKPDDQAVKAEEAAPVEPAAAETPVQPVNIEDNMMAWLEGLAAKQGARPEELLSKPEDRPQTAPEWAQPAAVEPPAPADIPPQAEPAQEVPPEPVLETQPEPVAEIPPPAETTPAVPPEPVLESQPEPITEVPPIVEPEKAEPQSKPVEEDITITTWLSALETDEVDLKAAPEAVPTAEAAQHAEEELPDWLRDLEKPAEPEPAQNPVEVESDLPDWLRTPVEPPQEAKAEQAPVLTPVPEPEPEEALPAWMEEPEHATSQAAPTEPEEWLPAEEAAAQIPEAEQEVVPELEQEFAPAAESVPVPEAASVEPAATSAGSLAPIYAQDKDGASLQTAQNALEHNALDEAIKEYTKLIKKGRLLEEVIHDLREASYRFPVDVIIWQTLGDAYMRANRLQDALDAYTKAEELLR